MSEETELCDNRRDAIESNGTPQAVESVAAYRRRYCVDSCVRRVRSMLVVDILHYSLFDDIPINSDLVLKNNVSRVTSLCHKSHHSNLNLSEIEKG